MLTIEKFNEIMNKNRSESEKVNEEEVTCTNGTSKEVLTYLKTLDDAEIMNSNVKALASEMFNTFKDVHNIKV